MRTTARERAKIFCARFGMGLPILEAPMAGACPVKRSIAVAQAGGMGGLGALLMSPEAISNWVSRFRGAGVEALQINVWVPGHAEARDAHHETELRAFLSTAPSLSLPFSGKPY
jgi:nitronate monooxygenase